MTDAVKETMKKTLDAQMERWLPASGKLWEDEHIFDGPFLQKHVFAVDPEDGTVTILRGWMMEGHQPAVSVDLSVPFETFCGELDEETFHCRGGNQNEIFFRSALPQEHADIVWNSSNDSQHAAFIARTWKAGRDEHVVAGTVSVKDGIATTDISFRQPLAALAPARTAAFGR